MTLDDLILFKNFVLSKNTYFTKGYANAFKVKTSGIIYSREPSGDLLAVSPQDILGDYFYIRNDEGINHTIGSQTSVVSDCIGYVFDDILTVNFVAFVRDADAMTLANNIRNTCAMYDKMKFVPRITNWNREQIIIDELSGLDELDIQAVLQRLSNWTIVRITMNAVKQYVPNRCITKPCKNCN